MICIEDFYGRTEDGFNTNFWADYDPDKGIVHFGGAWSDAPDMPLHISANY